MKSLVITLLLLFSFVISVDDLYAWGMSVKRCNYIWSTAVTGAADAPDYVYCDLNNNGTFTSQGATFAMQVGEADSLWAQMDTSSTGSLVQDGITVCSNTGAVDVNFLSSLDGSNYDTTSYYHEETDFADATVKTIAVTPTDYLKLTVDENGANNGCVVVRVKAVWK